LHSHDHSHHHHGAGSRRALAWSFAATALFVGIEVVAGIRAHSLALVSDAGHNATDALALALAWSAIFIQGRPADESRTYGYQRAGVLAAFVNALTLGALSLWILYESWTRLLNPAPVAQEIMLWVAVGGVVLNGGVMFALHRGSKDDLNVRAAFVHMLGDLVGAVGIIIGSFIIRATGWYRVDPILSAVIAILIVWTAWGIVRDSLNILLEGLPKGLDFKSVTGSLQQLPGVLDVHDLHIWSLGSNAHALSCHVLIDDMPPSQSQAILLSVNRILDKQFHIHHTTIQFEHVCCDVSPQNCVSPVVGVPAHHHHHH
jgi:cobalt-zinc-cadmium efflux system protein